MKQVKVGYLNKPDSMRSYAEKMTKKEGGAASFNSMTEKRGKEFCGESAKKISMKPKLSSSAADHGFERPYKKGGMVKKMIGGGIGPRYNKGGMCKADGGSIKGIADKVVKVMHTKPISDIAGKFMKKGGNVGKMIGGAVGPRATSKIGVIRKAGGKFAAGGAGKIRKGVMTPEGNPIDAPRARSKR